MMSLSFKIILAPLFAGLAIAVGIPLLLFYVYGIVPISLFRATYGAHSNSVYKCNAQTHTTNSPAKESSSISESTNNATDVTSQPDTPVLVDEESKTKTIEQVPSKEHEPEIKTEKENPVANREHNETTSDINEIKVV